MNARSRARLLLSPKLWAGLWLAVSLLLVAVPTATSVALSKTWLWLTALVLAALLTRPRHPRTHHRTGWVTCFAVLLPPTEQGGWKADGQQKSRCAGGSDFPADRVATQVIPPAGLGCWVLTQRPMLGPEGSCPSLTGRSWRFSKRST